MRIALWNAIILLSIGLTAPFTGAAQHYSYTRYTVEEGLPGNETYMVIEDHEGYLWIGTDRGVVRYNGYEFTTFTTADGLPDNTIFDFSIAPDSSIWFMTFNRRIGRYKDGVFTTFSESVPDLNPGYSEFCSSASFNGDTVAIKTFFSICRFLLRGDSLIPLDQQTIPYLSPTKTLDNILHRDIQILGDQDFFHHSYTNLQRVNDSVLLVVSGELEPPHSIRKKHKRLTVFDEKHDRIVDRLFLPDLVMYIRKINDRILLSVRNHGIYEYFPEQRTVKKIIALPFAISGFTMDRDNNFWMSTLSNGLIKVRSIDIEEISYFRGKNVVYCFYLDAPYVITTENLYKRTGDGWTLLKEKVDYLNTSRHEDTILVPGASGYAYRYTPQGGDSMMIKNRIMADNLEYIRTPDGNYLLIAGMQLVYVRYPGEEVSPHPPRINLPVGRISCLQPISEKEVYVGGLSGVVKFNHTDSTITDMRDQNPLFSNRIDNIQMMGDSTYLFSSRGAGIIIHHPDTTYSISVENGLLSELVINVVTEGDSVLWVASNPGVNRIQLRDIRKGKYKIEAFTAQDGLSSKKINHVEVHGDSVYVSTDKGLNIFHKNLRKTKTDVPIYINQVQINKKDTTVSLKYDLNYQQNVIDIYFTGISMRQEGQLMYKYRLGKLDSNWNYTPNRSIQLLSLPPDEYDLEIYALAPDGSSSTEPARIRFVINPPFWLTWWFMLLCLAAVGGVVWAVMHARIRRVRKDAETQSELYKLENKALSSQLNPHFIFNALTAIQHFILKKDRYDAYNYLTQFATLIRSILKNSEDEYVPLQEEIALLTRYLELEKIRFPEKFDYTIYVDDEVDISTVFTPSMLIQPYVENAIRHGLVNKEGQGKLEIAFYLEQNKLIAVIKDDGIGREKARELSKNRKHRSFAMGINQRRLQLLNELYGDNVSVEIEDLYENKQAVGTRISLHIPLELSD